MKHASYIVLLCLLLITCKSATETESKAFLTTVWTLESLNIEGEIVKPPDGQLYTIQFKKDSTFTGKNDCNDIFGEYEIKSNNSLVIFKVGGSKANCPNSMFLTYLDAIRSAKSYKIEKNRLYIYYRNNSILIFTDK